jgi:hypothetical protein
MGGLGGSLHPCLVLNDQISVIFAPLNESAENTSESRADKRDEEMVADGKKGSRHASGHLYTM